ncbi:MAG: hypothetical protein AAF628_32550 [Planctomycetota bacterium]
MTNAQVISCQALAAVVITATGAYLIIVGAWMGVLVPVLAWALPDRRLMLGPTVAGAAMTAVFGAACMVKRRVLLRLWGVRLGAQRARGGLDLVTAMVGSVGLYFAGLGLISLAAWGVAGADGAPGWGRWWLGVGLAVLCRPTAHLWAWLNRVPGPDREALSSAES